MTDNQTKDRNANGQLQARLNLRPPGGQVFVLTYFLCLTIFVAFAISNLVNFATVPRLTTILSGIWLAIVAGGILACILCEGGVRPAIRELRSTFSNQHYLAIRRNENQELNIVLGFMAGKQPIDRWCIRANLVTSIEWNRGQGSVNSGQNMDDWHVAVWYRPNQPKRRIATGQREETCHIIGQHGSRTDISQFGTSIVRFFRSNGIELDATQDACVYRSPASKTPGP